MPSLWLIDGHNLLHALREERAGLFSRLADFSQISGERVIAVLDGKGPAVDHEPHRTQRFEVIYSGDLSADALIEREVTLRKGQNVAVVTEDTAIRRISRGAGASVYTASEFDAVLKTAARERDDKIDKERIRSHGFNRPFDDKLKDRPS